MKRFLTVMLLLVVILGVMLYFTPKPFGASIARYVPNNACAYIYCRQTRCANVDIGFGYMVTCALADLSQTLACCGDVDGVSVTFNGSEQDVADVLARLRAVAVSRQQLGDLYVACYFSPRVQGGVTLDGNTVNVQIAYRNGTITVGSPLILGSY